MPELLLLDVATTAQNAMIAIEIQTGDNLKKIEHEITRLNSGTDTESTILLARNLNAHFFKQSRVAALFATAKRHGQVHFRDWHHNWIESDLVNVFRSSVAHFAASVYSQTISNQHDLEPPFNAKKLGSLVALESGILEPHSRARGGVVGTSLSFCSVDPEFGEPAALAGLTYNKKRFVDELTSIKRRDLDLDPSPETLDLFGDESPERAIASYVFELNQNGYEHGNRSGEDKKVVLPGLRLIALRKHVATNLAQIRSYADGFPELQSYVEGMFSAHRMLKYYEVAVSDQGMGMLGRFLLDRTEFRDEARNRNERANLLSRLLTETLTSKRGAPGAGGGLIRALRAARTLKGFISIRTDDFWFYCSFAGGESAPLEIFEVSGNPPSPIAGTHFNALFPLPR
jgi:hypothetical protein